MSVVGCMPYYAAAVSCVADENATVGCVGRPDASAAAVDREYAAISRGGAGAAARAAAATDDDDDDGDDDPDSPASVARKRANREETLAAEAEFQRRIAKAMQRVQEAERQVHDERDGETVNV